MDDELKEVRVADMHLTCMYFMATATIGMVNRCHGEAESTVKRTDGTTDWRCAEHRGLTRGEETGPVFETLITTVQVPDEVVIKRLSKARGTRPALHV